MWPTGIVETSPLALALVMLRLLIRFMGLALLAGGFVALVVDGTRSLAGGSLYVTTLGSEERRVGKECLSVCRSRWSPYH